MATFGGFVERFAKVNGVRLRYLIGGQGIYAYAPQFPPSTERVGLMER